MDDFNDSSVAMSTSALENKLRDLREKSNKHSQILTQKLASSQSGQNLLHIGTSLSTLPPDLHSLLTQLHPVLSSAEATEKKYMQQLQKLVDQGNQIRLERRKVYCAKECADLYQDLLAAESVVSRDAKYRRSLSSVEGESFAEVEKIEDKLDHASSLERCAHTTLCLVQDLQSSTDKLSALTASKITQTDSSKSALPSIKAPLEEDTERSQFLMKLAPRIRRLESDTIISLTHRMEEVLKSLQKRRERRLEEDEISQISSEEELLLMMGHCMRGLAFLGRGKEAESIFARVAIMPLIRSKVSMGRLDEGGSRGECAGLPSLLDEIVSSIARAFSPVLRLSEAMFDVGPTMEVDLVTAGVWAPIATALMADAGIKMAIFSPGIASILQQNYVALDSFLARLAENLLASDDFVNQATSGSVESLYFRPSLSRDSIMKAQDRIYSSQQTAEFSKRWNLPIYYQLRFGDYCNRLNTAVEQTKEGGWITNVFTGSEQDAESFRASTGFELTLFLELYDILNCLWKPDVILRPLTHRFLRGAVQLVGRVVSFIEDGMNGKIVFGVEKAEEAKLPENGNGSVSNGSDRPYPTRSPYRWGESEQDVASVAWELAILETVVLHDYVETVTKALADKDSSEEEIKELQELCGEVLKDSSKQIRPIVEKAWNEKIVELLTVKCSGPLAAVKGVAATYRMTNRPPPTQASPFVSTIIRPLNEFDSEFANRTPIHVGDAWKHSIVSTVADRYSVAVQELIDTVQRTEAALQNRRTRRAVSGGMSDGDKVKLQLYLDVLEFSKNVENVGISPASIPGIDKLKALTKEAEDLETGV